MYCLIGSVRCKKNKTKHKKKKEKQCTFHNLVEFKKNKIYIVLNHLFCRKQIDEKLVCC